MKQFVVRLVCCMFNPNRFGRAWNDLKPLLYFKLLQQEKNITIFQFVSTDKPEREAVIFLRL